MFKTQFQQNKQVFETVSSKPSMTIPDQSLTISQVLNKYASGTLPNMSKKPQYDYDETTPRQSDNLDNISPFRSQNYDLADYTLDSINNRNSLVANKTRKSDLEKQILVQKAIEDEAKKTKEPTAQIDQ